MGRSRGAITGAIVALLGCTLACDPAGSSGTVPTRTPAAAPLQSPHGTRVAAPTVPEGLRIEAVPSEVREPRARYLATEKARALDVSVMGAPQPKRVRPEGRGRWAAAPLPDSGPAEPPNVEAPVADARAAEAGATNPTVVAAFDSSSLVTNGENTGFFFIPPDPMGAAGPNHVVSVTNTSIRVHSKTGGLVLNDSLRDFFAPLTPLTFTFDPKILYDQHAGRFVIVTLERTDPAEGGPAETSRILVAVSADSGATGTWFVTAIDAATLIGGRMHWIDFPGLAVDEEAVYITGNMFEFFTSGNGSFGGVRLWVLDKGQGSGGLYDGGAASVGLFDPHAGSAIVTTTQPAHVFGTPPPDVGTFLLSFDGITSGTTEFFQVVRVDDPLGSPTFTEDYVALGNIDNLTGGVPDAPQSGTSALIDTNDRSLLHAVWRADSIWATTTIVPRTGANSGHATAYWVRIGTSNLDAPVVIEQGEVGGEDIATGTRTFYPSIAVNANLHVAIGFSASAATRFPGAYYAFHAAGDSPGSVGPSLTLRAGSAFYERDLGGSSHRWGDYSSVAVDPVDDCFWIYNEYATTQGNPTDGQSGRWATRFVKSCLAVCGDGTVQIGEECDDDNTTSGDGCDATCIVEFCGDAVINNSGTEACDDGNTVDTDACGNDCIANFCGDAEVNNGEECDDGNAVNEDACRNNCLVPSCGDGILDGGEACDDGNADDLDACGNDCVANFCGDAEVNNDETCDDGNTNDLDACLSDCTASPCGSADSDLDGAHDLCDLDDDNDGVEDGLDCAPLDPLASTIPAEAEGLLVAAGAPTPIAWADLGPGVSYDVITGSIASLHADGGVTAAGCLAGEVTPPSTSDGSPDPGPDEGRYYLVRPRNACGAGTYGFATSGAERLPAAGCP